MAARAGPVLVFGGRGFVGAAVCRELAKRGLPVAETFKDALADARAVVVSVGEAPWTEFTGGTKDRAVKTNGLTNVAVLKAAAEHKVPRVVLVNATMPTWGLISGYREGKEMAEAEAKHYPETSGLGADDSSVLVLKPGVITGTKYWGKVPLPFGLALEPARFLLRSLAGPCAWLEKKMPRLLGGILSPAVRVEEMATAAADVVQSDAKQGVRVLEPAKLVGYKSA